MSIPDIAASPVKVSNAFEADIPVAHTEGPLRPTPAVPGFLRKPPVDRWSCGEGQLCGTYPQRQLPATTGRSSFRRNGHWNGF